MQKGGTLTNIRPQAQQAFFFAILGRDPREICYSAQLCHFWSIKNKLAISHTIAIKLKENVTMLLVCVY